MDSTENRRQGACDRCRGQKLRCVGLAKPIFSSGSRFQHNEIPCERCKKAKVACYSVRPAPRRTTTAPDSNHDTQAAGTQSGPERRSSNQTVTGSRPPQNTQRSNSVDSLNDQQSDQQVRDIDALSAMPTMSSEWMTYLQDHEMGCETRPWMLDSNHPNFCQDSAMDSLGDRSMIDLMSQAASVEGNPVQFAIDANFSQTGSTHHASSRRQRQSNPDRRMSSSSKTGWPPQSLVQNLESTKACIRALAKFNERLLHEKSSLEDASTSAQKGLESGQQFIGQTLHRCQDFLSILRRLKSCLCSDSDSNTSRTAPEWSYSTEGGGSSDDGIHLHPRSRQSNSSSAAQSRSHSGLSSFTPSSRSLSSTSQTPAAAPPVLEIPILLSILSCYACILQSYDDLFTPIFDAVTRSTPTVPATLTGLHLDGFGLDGHNTLQLECLTNVSFNLLEKIENILVGSPGHGGLFNQARGGLLGDKLFAGLIDALYDQNEQNAVSQRNGKREVRAKRLIREIQAALKTIDL